MTVSRALNGGRSVRPETRARIEGAVAALGYTPNNAAKALATSRHLPKIAFLFDAPNATFLAEMVSHGFEEAAVVNVLLVFIKARAEEDPAITVKSVIDLGIDGVILPPPLCDDARLRLLLAESGLRVVAIGCCDEDPTVSTIGIDDRRAAYEVTEYLIRLGHRRIGLILGHPRHRSSERRRAGYEAALEAHGFAPDRSLQWEGRYTFESAMAAAEQALDMQPPITALFASSDDMAAAAISVARGRGINVPRSLSVCGFDDSEIALMMFPRLTTVGQPIAEMVREGVQQMATELHMQRCCAPLAIKKLLLGHTLAFRDSDAPPEDRHPRFDGRSGKEEAPNWGPLL
jgi:LacI family transcriptional regulator